MDLRSGIIGELKLELVESVIWTGLSICFENVFESSGSRVAREIQRITLHCVCCFFSHTVSLCTDVMLHEAR